MGKQFKRHEMFLLTAFQDDLLFDFVVSSLRLNVFLAYGRVKVGGQ